MTEVHKIVNGNHLPRLATAFLTGLRYVPRKDTARPPTCDQATRGRAGGLFRLEDTNTIANRIQSTKCLQWDRYNPPGDAT